MKLKAFTLMEVLIGMLLSSIVVMGSLNAYNLVQGQFSFLMNVNNEVYEYKAFEANILYHLHQSEYVEIIDQALIFSSNNNTNSFTFYPEYVLQNQDGLVVDTLKIKATFQEGNFENELTDYGIIDAGIIDIYPFEEKQSFYIKKQYSAADKMNYNQ